MLTDLICDITVLRIRKDFGEFCGTLFDLILKKNGCSVSDLNFLIPKINYSLIRSTLLDLFQHNLIYFSPTYISEEKNPGTIFGIKIFPCLHACLYRFRFLRFFSLMEHEYGNLGSGLTKKFYEKGQLFLNKFTKKTLSKKKIILTENLLVQMARDGYITPNLIFREASSIKLHTVSYQGGREKPSFLKKKIPWRLDMLKMNLGLKINIIFSILYQNFGEIFYSNIRSCASRIFSYRVYNFQKTWFNLDTLSDITSDTVKIVNKDEMNLIQVFENGLLNNSYFFVQNARIKINFKTILMLVQIKTVENLIINQFGKTFFQIFKILSSDTEMSEQKIASECFEEEILIRKEIFKMFRLGFLLVEERSNISTIQTHKKNFNCCININFVRKRFISEILKSIFNVFIKIQDFENFFQKIKLFSTKNRSNNLLIKQRQALFLSITKLDEILNVLYS